MLNKDILRYIISFVDHDIDRYYLKQVCKFFNEIIKLPLVEKKFEYRNWSYCGIYYVLSGTDIRHGVYKRQILWYSRNPKPWTGVKATYNRGVLLTQTYISEKGPDIHIIFKGKTAYPYEYDSKTRVIQKELQPFDTEAKFWNHMELNSTEYQLPPSGDEGSSSKKAWFFEPSKVIKNKRYELAKKYGIRSKIDVNHEKFYLKKVSILGKREFDFANLYFEESEQYVNRQDMYTTEVFYRLPDLTLHGPFIEYFSKSPRKFRFYNRGEIEGSEILYLGNKTIEINYETEEYIMYEDGIVTKKGKR